MYIYIYEYPGSQLKSAAQISTMSVIFLEIALGGNIWKSIRPGKSPSFHAHVNGNIIEPKGFNVAMLPEDTAQVLVQSSIPAP